MKKMILFLGCFFALSLVETKASEDECFSKAIDKLEEEDPDSKKSAGEQADILNDAYAKCWNNKHKKDVKAE